MNHTPGPWVVSGYDVVTAWFDYSGDEPPEVHHHVIVHDCNYSGWADPKVPLANARLIAAAPDLIAALEAMLSNPDKASREQARAALAKARQEDVS